MATGQRLEGPAHKPRTPRTVGRSWKLRQRRETFCRGALAEMGSPLTLGPQTCRLQNYV